MLLEGVFWRPPPMLWSLLEAPSYAFRASGRRPVIGSEAADSGQGIDVSP
jgi:hypothetical protein